ncbi:hypothetical protein SAMN05216431_1157 [Ligilactobacillus sp. WC1T17]|uniref:Glycosyltransferase n=1 Tax=Ligilactobacillus ruminis TaxID=1623 RepID=A0ABY1ADS6_9LACO|nr:hypothetical protein SAMN05216431_1157 [Ligilactobacillus ruminis]
MIKDVETGQKVLESIATLNEAAYELYKMVQNDSEQTADFVKTMQTLFLSLRAGVGSLVNEERALKTDLLLDNALTALNRALSLEEKKAQLKVITNELIPAVGESYVDLLFWGTCYPDNDRMFDYYNNQMRAFYPAPVPDKKRHYKYDLSIGVMLVDNLAQVKKCLEALNKAIPANLRCEFILYNDGCGQEVAAYLDTLDAPNVKIINYKNAVKMPSVIWQLVEGKQVLFLTSADILYPQAISNMVSCLAFNGRIGAVSPVLLSEAKEVDETSNPYLYRQKSELKSDIILARSDEILMPTLLGAYFPFAVERYNVYAYRAMSLIGRRNGKLLVEAGDAYAVTKDIVVDADALLDGIKPFEDIFGINPLLSQNLAQDLLDTLDYDKKERRVDILGINSDFGINLLEIQARVRQESQNLRTNIYSLTEQDAYARDLESIAKKSKLVKNWAQDFDKCFPNARFDYILIEHPSEGLMNLVVMLKILERLKDGGILAIHTLDEKMPLNDYEPKKVVGDWQILYKDGE